MPSNERDQRVVYLREALRLIAQWLIEQEVSAAIAAAPYERSDARRTRRNGYRRRVWQTALGPVELHIPKLRQGTYYPSVIDRLHRAEPALRALAEAAYEQGLSPRQIDEALTRLDLPALPPDQVAEIDEQLYELAGRYHQRSRRAAWSGAGRVSAIGVPIPLADPEHEVGSTVNLPHALLVASDNSPVLARWLVHLLRLHLALAGSIMPAVVAA